MCEVLYDPDAEGPAPCGVVLRRSPLARERVRVPVDASVLTVVLGGAGGVGVGSAWRSSCPCTHYSANSADVAILPCDATKGGEFDTSSLSLKTSKRTLV